MQPSFRRLVLLLALLCALCANLALADGFVFSILPKSLQRNPRVDLNVITEMTPEGKKRPKVTPDHPAYYVAQAGGYKQLGQTPVGHEHPPPLPDLERVMAKALATAGFLPEETPAHPATIAVVYNWGSHTTPTEDDQSILNELAAAQAAQENGSAPPPPSATSSNFAEDQLPRALSDLALRKDLLERASIVGGNKFAAEFSIALTAQAKYQSPVLASALGNSDMPSTPFDDPGCPFYRFYNRDERTMHLVEESFSSFYFVIATGYDYAALAKGQHVVLWRTKMTVNSLGVAMKETLPSLVIAAGQFLGKDMPDAETITKKILRGGNVEIGTPTVKDYSEGPVNPPANTHKK